MALYIKKNNERSEAIELIKMMDSVVQQTTWIIKSVGGESTLNTGKQRMFPDVILYGDTGRTEVLQGWEVKMPDVPITNMDFVHDAQRKADVLGVNSCFIWNYSHGILFVRENDAWTKAKQWDVEEIQSRPDVELYRQKWEIVIRDVLFTLNHYFQSGILRSSTIDSIISESIFSAIITRNQALVSDALKFASIRDTTIRAHISVWWNRVHLEYHFDKQNSYEAYARCVLLNWINKFTFANLIKGWHNAAMAVEGISNSISPQNASKIFTEMTMHCDFYNIFVALKYADLIPQSTWTDLTDFNAFLCESHISNIAQESLQAILEGTINQFKRNTVGQFTTPETLAKILVRAGISDLTLPAIDPCCGTGTIAKLILDEKERTIGIEKAFETTYASDKYSFPLQISNISMTNVHAKNLPSLLFQSNAFDLKIGNTIRIHNPVDGRIEAFLLPAWGSVVSNLPFVAFDQKGREESDNIKATIKQVAKETHIRISGKIDLYQALLLKLWNTMSDNASVAVITSNSWLGTSSGADFFRALNYYYAIESVIASGKDKWFSNSDVIAVMLFLTKKKDIAPPDTSSEVHFGLIKKSINELSDGEVLEIADYIKLKQSMNNELLTLRSLSNGTIDDLLKKNVIMNSLFYDVTWLLEIGQCFRPITDCFKVFRGIKTGQDEIYYLKNPSMVDAPYVERILLNARNVDSLLADPDTDAFSCDKTLEELAALGHTKTIDYIHNYQGSIHQSVPNKDTFWMNMRNGSFAGSYEIRLFTAMNPEKRFFYGLLNKSCKVNQRIIGLKPVDLSVDVSLCHALLNSIMGAFYTEATGFPRGQGVLDTSKERIEKVLMLDPDRLTQKQVAEVMDAFLPLLHRKILPFSEELEMEDRVYFEHVVLSCYGIDSYYHRIKNALLEMQQVRLSVKEGRHLNGLNHSGT